MFWATIIIAIIVAMMSARVFANSNKNTPKTILKVNTESTSSFSF